MTITESLIVQFKIKGYLSDYIASPHMSPKVGGHLWLGEDLQPGC